MAQFGQVQLCDYCHQKPKFAPYNYCGKVCGSRARATGNTPSNTTPLCKQCGQRPVHRGHQFCGRNCANNWKAMNGQINTGGNFQPQHQVQQPWGTMQQPPQMQPPPIQSFTQGGSGGGGGGGGDGGDGGGLKGFVRGLKGLISQNSQSQQSQPQQQKSTTPDPMLISPPITPMGSNGTPPSPGLDQQYHTPQSPTNPGLPDPDGDGQTNGSKSRTMTMATSQTNPPGGDDSDLDFDPYPDPNHGHVIGGTVPVQAQAQVSIQVNSSAMGAGGHGNGNWDPSGPNNFPSQQSTWPKSSSTCRLNGCENPVFVDPVSRRAGEYCSQRHREDATTFGQASPCIMCQKLPRGQKDHFCSRACREKALRP